MGFSSYCINTVCTEFFKNIKTLKTQKSYLHALNEFFQDYPEYEDFTDINCSEHLDNLQFQKNQKYSTVVKKKKQLSSFFSFIEEHIDTFNELPLDFSNQFKNVSLPEEPETIHVSKILSLEELDKLITYLRLNNPACMIAVAFSFKLMLKISEFIVLQWKDVIEASDGYALRLKDGPSYRYISLPEDVFMLLMEYQATIPNAICLFPKPRTNDIPVSQQSLRQWLKQAEDEIAIPQYTFNDLRNAGISYAVSQDCSVKLITQQLNFKSRSHITRLTSVSSLTFANASDYTNIVFKGKTSSTEDIITKTDEITPKTAAKLSDDVKSPSQLVKKSLLGDIITD